VITLSVNGVRREIQSPPGTWLAWSRLRSGRRSRPRNTEAANALAAPALAGALYDATGKICRRLPLKPSYVQAALKA